jgi:AcrR family transcriptional regulator
MGILERKEREKEARRTQILDAAEKVFKEKGISQATMDDIAREAELAKGTIYLYYRNKDELHVGLILRSFELVNDAFAGAFTDGTLAIQRLQAVGEAYWHLSSTHPFQCGLMCNSDLPQRSQVSDILFTELESRSNNVWKFLIALIDEAKAEGTIRSEIDSYSLALLLWLNSMSVLRLYQRTKLTAGTVMSAKRDFNMAELNYPRVYNFAIASALANAVTPEGAKYVPALTFPSKEELGLVCSDNTADPSFSVTSQLIEETE